MHTKDPFLRRFHKAMTAAFGENIHHYDATTPLAQFGDSRQIDDLFDELEFEFSGEIEEHQRTAFKAVGQAMEWAQMHVDIEEDNTSDSNETPSPFAWEEQLSFLQKTILKLSGIVGVITFFLGVQLIVRGQKELGGTLTAAGMFLATQMFWGLKKCYNWLEKKHLKLLQKVGYGRLFWLFFVSTFVIEVVGIAAVLKFFGIEIPKLP